jgi:hypothetical protein
LGDLSIKAPVFLVGGLFFGLALWLVNENRYRKRFR